MTDAAVRLWLKVMDPTALTARETLQRALGYGPKVRDVARSEIWVFRWTKPVHAADTLSKLARGTNLLQNPNKHKYEIVVDGQRLSPRGNVWVLVSTPGVGAGMEQTLASHRLIEGEIPTVRRAQLWELDLDVPETERHALAEEVAITRGRKRGLLANPHVEDTAIYTKAPTASALAESLQIAEQTAAK